MIDYQEDLLISVIFRWRGSVVPRALWYAGPAACLAPLLLFLDDLAPEVRGGIGVSALQSSVFWNCVSGSVVLLVGFRTRQALGRFWEGTGLLHQMRGEWFDAVSCLMTFSRGAKGAKAEQVTEFRHSLVRLMSLMHGSALEEIQGSAQNLYEVIDIRGLDRKTRSYLRDCKDQHGFNRVEVLQHMVQVLITQNLDDGVLKIAPPILSRVYQTLSRGLVNLLNARKITDTKFPFPYVQLISMLLVFHSILTPVVITGMFHSKPWAAVFTFMPIFGLCALNKIAAELECPFGEDENDLPLRHFQQEMNSSLLMLLSEDADHLVHTSREAIMDVRSLTSERRHNKSFTGSLELQSTSIENWRMEEGKENARSPSSSNSIELAVQGAEDTKLKLADERAPVLEQAPMLKAAPPALPSPEPKFFDAPPALPPPEPKLDAGRETKQHEAVTARPHSTSRPDSSGGGRSGDGNNLSATEPPDRGGRQEEPRDAGPRPVVRQLHPSADAPAKTGASPSGECRSGPPTTSPGEVGLSDVALQSEPSSRRHGLHRSL